MFYQLNYPTIFNKNDKDRYLGNIDIYESDKEYGSIDDLKVLYPFLLDIVKNENIKNDIMMALSNNINIIRSNHDHSNADHFEVDLYLAMQSNSFGRHFSFIWDIPGVTFSYSKDKKKNYWIDLQKQNIIINEGILCDCRMFLVGVFSCYKNENIPQLYLSMEDLYNRFLNWLIDNTEE